MAGKLKAVSPKPASKLSEVLSLPFAENSPWYKGSLGSVFVFSDRDDKATALVDLSGEKPRMAVIEGCTTESFDVHPVLGWLLIGQRVQVNLAIIIKDPFEDPNSRQLLPPYEDKHHRGFEWGAWMGDQPVLWPAQREPRSFNQPAAPGCFLVFDGRGYTRAKGLPDVANVPKRKGKSVLGDNTEILVCNGKGFEKRDGTFVETFDFDIRGFNDPWTSVACGDDGLYYADGGQLLETHRGWDCPHVHAGKVKDFKSVAAGPGGTLVLRLGENKRREIGVLYDRPARALTFIGPTLFKDRRGPVDSLEGLDYLPARDRLVGIRKALYIESFSAVGGRVKA